MTFGHPDYLQIRHPVERDSWHTICDRDNHDSLWSPAANRTILFVRVFGVLFTSKRIERKIKEPISFSDVHAFWGLTASWLLNQPCRCGLNQPIELLCSSQASQRSSDASGPPSESAPGASSSTPSPERTLVDTQPVSLHNTRFSRVIKRMSEV